MVAANERWVVLPHRPIEELDEHVWRVQGSLPNMPLKRVMTVAKSERGLVIFNGIALDEASMKRIEAWGTPVTLVVPNGFHRLDAPAYRRRYPDVEVLCPQAALGRVGKVVAVDGTLRDFPRDDHVTLFHLEGVGEQEAAMMVRCPQGVTLVLNDAVFNQPHGRGLAGAFFRHVTKSTGGPIISRVARTFLVRNRAAFRDHLERLADTPDLRRIIVSHHRTIDDDPAGVLRHIATTI